jgi:hypothetical protein
MSDVPRNGVPAWVTTAVQVTTQVGVPTVFAGVLLWFVLSSIGTTMSKIVEEEKARTATLVSMQGELLRALDNQADRFETVIRENIEANRTLAERRRYERESSRPAGE